jgi:hypothetical protein
MPYVAFAKGRLVLQAHELLPRKKENEIVESVKERGLSEEERVLLTGTLFTSMEQVVNLQARSHSLMTVYERVIEEFLDSHSHSHSSEREKERERETVVIDALCLEPVLLTHGSKSMSLCDPLYHHLLVKACRKRGIPVVFDEVSRFMCVCLTA